MKTAEERKKRQGARGLGTLYKRGRLYWWEYRRHGKRKFRPMDTGSYEKADTLRKDLLNQWKANRWPANTDCPLRSPEGGPPDFPTLVTASYTARGRRSTLVEVKRVVKRFVADCPAERLSGITQAHINAWVNKWRAEGGRAKTLNLWLSLLRAAVERIAPKAPNPFKEFGRLREDDSREVPPLDDQVVARYLAAAMAWKPWVWQQMMFLAHTGCRLSTMYLLRVKDVQWRKDNLHLTLWKTTRRIKDRFADVPIPKPLVPILRLLTAGKDPDDFVFKEPWKSALRGYMHRLAKRTKPTLPLAHPHQLRQTWATLTLERTGDFRAVMDAGGWSQLATLQKYVKSNTAGKRRVIESVTYLPPAGPQGGAPA